MPDADRLHEYVEAWRDSCTDFLALTRELPEEEWHLPTDLPGWDVADIVAHTAHLETVLAGGPEETVEVPPDLPHLRGPMNHYTEQGVIARKGRSLPEMADEIEKAVAVRSAELEANPPTDPAAAPPRTPGGIGWDTGTLLRNRPLDVWMHEQDIRRATDRPGNLDSAGARHTVGYLLSAALPMIVGKRVKPAAGTSVCVEVPELGLSNTVAVGEDGKAAASEVEQPTVRLQMTTEAFTVLAGGRRTPDRVHVDIEGDRSLADAVLAAMATTP